MAPPSTPAPNQGGVASGQLLCRVRHRGAPQGGAEGDSGHFLVSGTFSRAAGTSFLDLSLVNLL